MSGNGNQVPLAPNQRGPGAYPRAPTPLRADCYHSPAGTGAPYVSASAPGAGQNPSPASLRIQPTPQPPPPPQPQQDLSKSSLPPHNYVPQQNQTPQTRPPYPNYPFRSSQQHNTRPTSQARQQQSFIPGTAGTGTTPVVYSTLVFPPSMGLPQSYQQPQPQRFFQFMPPFLNYPSSPASHSTPYFYPSGTQQLPPPNMSGSSQASRNNNTNLVTSQGAPATPNATSATGIQYPVQTQPHIHQTMPGIRSNLARRVSHKIPIIDPNTLQEISSDDNQYLSGDSSERQTPQLEPNRIVEEFSRKVNEVANQPSPENLIKPNLLSKIVDAPVTISPPTSSLQQHQPSAITSNSNNSMIKSDVIGNNEAKCLGPDIAAESNDTPVVSAISDSPVIVPKMCSSIKLLQKSPEHNIQPSIVIDNNKSLLSNKPNNNKNIPVVPQSEEDNTIEVTVSTVTLNDAAPQPQRIREPKVKLEEKEKDNEEIAIEAPKDTTTSNGPTHLVGDSSADSICTEVISPVTSQISYENSIKIELSQNPVAFNEAQLLIDNETNSVIVVDNNIISESEEIASPSSPSMPSATELLSASIEAAASKGSNKMSESPDSNPKVETLVSTSHAQAMLNQNLSSCQNPEPTETSIDLNLNISIIDSDSANGNTSEPLPNTATEDNKQEDVNKNEKSVKNSINSDIKAANNEVIASSEIISEDQDTYENGKIESDQVVEIDQESAKNDESPSNSDVFVTLEKSVYIPKYNYGEGQWSPFNTEGRKCYDIGFLMQVKDDPTSKKKPDENPALEVVMKSRLQDGPMLFAGLSSRPLTESFFPTFGKSPGTPRNTPRDSKKDGRNIATSGKGSVKLLPNQSGNSPHKLVLHVSLPLREEVKLNQSENAWKPTRFKKETSSEDEQRNEELYKKFRGILNKLTPQKFDTLLEKVKLLEIDNQKRLEGVIDLVFEKAIEEPNFSEAYAAMCNKLSILKVPADNPTTADKCVNFRGLIISKCQAQFETNKVDEQVLKLEKELNESTDPLRRKELQLLLDEENRRVRKRSVGNVRFIGELYKLKMLTANIMLYCMNYLIDKLDEEKLECLCKLLTTIGQQLETKYKNRLDEIFKKMQDIVQRKSNKISSRVRFMIQDVIELRRRNWVGKSVVDTQPKTMDQIQKEAEQQQRHIELMNSAPISGSFRRDDGGRGKRGDNRRQNSNSFMDSSNWQNPRSKQYSVDTNKLKAVSNKSLSNIKLGPPVNSGWNQGSGTKNTNQNASNSLISLPATTTNMYSMLAENVPADPTTLKGNKDATTPGYHSKGASIERSTFSSREFSSGPGSRSGSMGMPGSSTSASPVTVSVISPVETPASLPNSIPQEPISDSLKKTVKAIVDLNLINPDDEEMVAEIKQRFSPQNHAGVTTEIINVALEKSTKEVAIIAKSLQHLASTNTISIESFVLGLNGIFELAPDLYIDIPMLYDHLAVFLAPCVENKLITLEQLLKLSEMIISANQGHLFLRALIKELKLSMGPSFVKSKWHESGLQISQWMSEDQVMKFIEDNKLEFLEGGTSPVSEETTKIFTPSETQNKLVNLMHKEMSCECIRGWVQDNLGKASNEDWFMRSLIQAICDYALFGPEKRDGVHFNRDKMSKYIELINEFGESKQTRELNCLFGIQQLIHRLEHPQGFTVEIFQYLAEQYIISAEGFLAWEDSEKEPEGKGVMMKALTSFFTNIKEADNEDSCSED